ncbi:MAG: DUF4390 domain-containing protein [Smithellaceae bacterium]|nr:DUF4390 domain-containing protein [Smithellaceae bacterium]
MCKKILFLGISICLLLSPTLGLAAYDGQAKIKDFLVTNNDRQILVFAKVTDCFTKEMEKAILSGIPTTFTFLIDLREERPFWFDRAVRKEVVKQTIKYDNVRRMFSIYSSNDRETATYQDLEAAKQAMAELNGVALTQLSYLDRKKNYYVKVKAQLDKVRLPLHMEYIFFFVSLWDFETPWYTKKIVFRS